MKILRHAEVQDRTGFSDEHIRRLEQAGKFPKRFKLVPGSGRNGAVGWLESEVDDWIKERLTQRDGADTAQ